MDKAAIAPICLWHNARGAASGAACLDLEGFIVGVISDVRRCLSVLVLLGLAALAAAADQGTVQLEVIGLENFEGQLIIRAYSGEKTWLTDGFIMEKKVDLASWPKGEPVVLTLELPRGEYALSVIHDQDGDGKLKTYSMGMPAEPVVMSNNAPGNFGPPRYKDAKFQLADEVVVQRLDMS